MVTITLVFTVPNATDAAATLKTAIDAIYRAIATPQFIQTSADALSVAPVAQAVAVPLPFKAGDKVMVDGDTVTGEGTVLECWAGGSSLPSKAKRNRPNQPYPQVEVEMLRSKKKFHFNGADLDEDKLSLIVD